MTRLPLAERLRSRALARLLPALGPQWMLVTQYPGVAVPQSASSPRAVVVTAPGACPPGAVRGAPDRIPIQSESATGVLVVTAHDAPGLAGVAAEARRLLQPGGVVVFLGVWSADQVEGLDAVLTRAGLTPWRRVAIRRVGAETSALADVFPSVEERRAASASGAERVECAVVARRPGGVEADLPTGASVLASMFLPRIPGRGGISPGRSGSDGSRAR